jgi:sigma-B regulation protein RsbQ
MSDILKKMNVNQTSVSSEHTLLFVHGYGCNQDMWRFIVPKFKDYYNIILVDLVGFGKSSIDEYDFDKYSTLHGHADDIVELCNYLNLKNVVLIGHSVSAMIGALATIKSPERFSALVMVAPSPRYINDKDYIGGFSKEDIDNLLQDMDINLNTWSANIAPLVMGNPDRPSLTKELEESFCKLDPKIAMHFANVTFRSDNREDLKKIPVNTLVIQCKNDALVSEEIGRYVHKNIKNSSYSLIDTNGHCPHLSNPELTYDSIIKFLKEI